eukprot:gene30062-35031_t
MAPASAAGDAAESETGQNYYCSYALSGDNLMHQALYCCRDCSPDGSLCCCGGCKDKCHAGHNVEYIADGKGYCDCGKGSLDKPCCLITASTSHARQLLPNTDGRLAPGVNSRNPIEFVELHTAPALASSQCATTTPAAESGVTAGGGGGGNGGGGSAGVGAGGDGLLQRVATACKALVGESKETFWVNNGDEPRCVLEELALDIYRYHVGRLGLEREGLAGGAEWWVQVKDMATAKPGVDIHYDKDEEVAEAWDIGVYPDVSTVTYFSDAPGSAPTVVLSKTASEEVEVATAWGIGEYLDVSTVTYCSEAAGSAPTVVLRKTASEEVVSSLSSLAPSNPTAHSAHSVPPTVVLIKTVSEEVVSSLSSLAPSAPSAHCVPPTVVLSKTASEEVVSSLSSLAPSAHSVSLTVMLSKTASEEVVSSLSSIAPSAPSAHCVPPTVMLSKTVLEEVVSSLSSLAPSNPTAHSAHRVPPTVVLSKTVSEEGVSSLSFLAPSAHSVSLTVVLSKTASEEVVSSLSSLAPSAPSAHCVPPTVVLSKTVSEEVDSLIERCALVYPKVGRHLAFNGKLLHGAPAVLRPSVAGEEDVSAGSEGVGGSGGGDGAGGSDGGGGEGKHRITFLVNVWMGHRPAAVNRLPESVVASVQDAVPSSSAPVSLHLQPDPQPAVVTHVDDARVEAAAEAEEAGAQAEGSFVVVPFISAEADWGVEEGESEELLESTVEFEFEEPTAAGDDLKSHHQLVDRLGR